MKIILTTNRLILREFELRDANKMWALNDDPAVLKFTGDQPFLSVEDARNFIKNYDAYQQHEFGRWAVIKKKNNANQGLDVRNSVP